MIDSSRIRKTARLRFNMGQNFDPVSGLASPSPTLQAHFHLRHPQRVLLMLRPLMLPLPFQQLLQFRQLRLLSSLLSSQEIRRVHRRNIRPREHLLYDRQRLHLVLQIVRRIIHQRLLLMLQGLRPGIQACLQKQITQQQRLGFNRLSVDMKALLRLTLVSLQVVCLHSVALTFEVQPKSLLL